jgi:hypothetical protein
MSEREKHLFTFTAGQIAKAANDEAEYHDQRYKHWMARYEDALIQVKATAKVIVSDSLVTGGRRFGLDIDYGDPTAYREATLAMQKLDSHAKEAARFHSDAKVYGSQDSPGIVTPKQFELDAEDVAHFRLGGEERPD